VKNFQFFQIAMARRSIDFLAKMGYYPAEFDIVYRMDLS